MMQHFKDELTKFGSRYRDEMLKKGNAEWQNPEFRRNFLELFKSVGVDPLSSSKNMWSQALGTGLVQFYADLSVAASSICIATRPLNGGLISLRELTERLKNPNAGKPAPVVRIAAGGTTSTTVCKAASASDGITEDDVISALSKLSILGGGYSLIELGGERFVRSVSEELETDGASLLGAASRSRSYSATVQGASLEMGWSTVRVNSALDGLVRESLAWVDICQGKTVYYFPSLMGIIF